MQPYLCDHRVMEISARDLISDDSAGLLQIREKLMQAAIENLFNTVVGEPLVNPSGKPFRLVRISAGDRTADCVQGALQRTQIEAHGARMPRVQQQQLRYHRGFYL